MVTVLPQVDRSPSFGQRLSQGIGGGLEMGSQIYNEHQKKEAFQSLGIDPRVANLPKEAQGAYFKQIFAPEKQMTPLQQSQQKLAEERLKALQGQQNLYQRLFGDEQSEVPSKNPISSQSQQGQSGFDLSIIPEDKLKQGAAFAGQPGEAGVLGNMFKGELERRGEEKKYSFEREKLGRHEETEISKPVLIEMNQIRKNIPLQEQAILDIQEASPNVSALDYFADVTGFEPLRSAEGAKLKTGIKDFFLSDLTRVGTRPNQWIEQQLADALPKIGRSPEANLITSEGLKFKLDLAKKRIETIDRMAEKDREKYGFVKGDIDSRAYNEMKKYVIDRQKELQDSIKKIKSLNKGKKNTVVMVSPEGSTYEILSDDIDEAIEHGYNFSK